MNSYEYYRINPRQTKRRSFGSRFAILKSINPYATNTLESHWFFDKWDLNSTNVREASIALKLRLFDAGLRPRTPEWTFQYEWGMQSRFPQYFFAQSKIAASAEKWLQSKRDRLWRQTLAERKEAHPYGRPFHLHLH